MTPSQIAELLGMCSAFDRRTVGAMDVTAWHRVLGDIDATDAQQAVADHYSDTRDWIMPADIRRRVKALRAGRLAAAHPVYDGRPDETGAQSAAAIRALAADAAAGRLPARPIRAALESGSAVPSPRLAAELAAVGQTPGGQPEIGVNVLSVPCQQCAAPAGRSCRNRRRTARAEVHPWRLDDARRAASSLPPVSREDVEAEQARRREASRQATAATSTAAALAPGVAE
ncbi:hypothetical protein [Streptacidiphilus albus]|uniref:hypothetical protein n=1 Tax=Streptacidiphilus albus TaxID=105425 RepID=UPI00068F4B25|nr:hypothetical protein [Streptacidiphilus albus]